MIAQIEGKTIQNLTINSLYTKPTSNSEDVICVGNELRIHSEEIEQLQEDLAEEAEEREELEQRVETIENNYITRAVFEAD